MARARPSSGPEFPACRTSARLPRSRVPRREPEPTGQLCRWRSGETENACPHYARDLSEIKPAKPASEVGSGVAAQRLRWGDFLLGRQRWRQIVDRIAVPALFLGDI